MSSPITFVIKNLDSNNNQQIRLTIEGGSASGSFNSTINGDQTGAFEIFENNTDLRVCLAPFIEIECLDAIEISSLLQVFGTFDIYIDDLTNPFATNITTEQLITLLEENELIEIVPEEESYTNEMTFYESNGPTDQNIILTFNEIN